MAKKLRVISNFVSQATLDAGFTPPEDALGHGEIATSLLWKIAWLGRDGIVAAIHGDWGRGKTDVLARIAHTTYTGKGLPARFAPKAIWVNPWQYGTPDLLSPVVLSLLERTESPAARAGMRTAAETVIKAGVSFGLKAVGLTVPGGKIFEAAADEAKSLLEGLFDATKAKGENVPDPDPVARMGERFRELVDAWLLAQGQPEDAQLLVLIDDLDRCAPERQVALLESIRFLVSAGARATFIVALDPVLVREAIRLNYRTEAVDSDQYLEKMFDMRIHLPAMSSEAVIHLFQALLDEKPQQDDRATVGWFIEDRLQLSREQMTKSVKYALIQPDFRNPRLIRRLVDKLYLLAISRPKSFPWQQAPQLDMFLVWMCVCERTPQLRAAMQVGYRESYEESFTDIFELYEGQFKTRKVGGQELPPSTEHISMAKAILTTLGLPGLEHAGKLLSLMEWLRRFYIKEYSEPRSLQLEEMDVLLRTAGL